MSTDSPRHETPQQRYASAIETARSAITDQDFEFAMKECDRAEGVFGPNTETRDLRKQIIDLRARQNYSRSGDMYMSQRDYSNAAAAYENAAKLNPTEDIEEKWRLAQAHVKLLAAEKALQSGDATLAGQLVQTSIWLHKTDEARTVQSRIPASGRTE